MHRSSLAGLFLASVLAAIAGAAPAQQALEIISLRHRTVEQVLPVLQPLVEPGGTLSGSRGQLFVRASPANVAEIKRALDAIDRPARRLQISVRFDDAEDRERRELAGSATVGSAGSRVTVTAEESRRTSASAWTSACRCSKAAARSSSPGNPGRCGFGQHGNPGHRVRLRGDAALDGRAGRARGRRAKEMPGARPGQVQGQRVATTVTTRSVNGPRSAAPRRRKRETTAASAARTTRTAQSRRVFLKVEELP